MSLKYRADIDGLRAIAVLVVILFHTNIPGFSGGFVGVDVFFVISGFLITSIILKEIREEKFSIARFYERRIRRIFPALFPLIFFTLAVGALLFDYKAFKGLGDSVTATTLFISNILFFRETGYFAAPSLQKPLLHTWSLAVEEQFYIIYPLLLVIIYRFLNRRYLLWLGGVGLLSLLACIWGGVTHPGAAFYLVPFRAWELLAGSILSLGVLPAGITNVKRNLLSLSGLVLIGYSVVYFTEATVFPGYNAIVPVLGASLIIYSGIGGESAISRLLSWKPLVYTGLISYSLYLWHWPLIAFAKYMLFRDLSPVEVSGIIITTFLIAILSLRFIEKPFRGNQPIIPDRRNLFVLSGVVMLIATVAGVVIHLQDGMPYRSEENEIVMNAQEDAEWIKLKDFQKISGNISNDNIPPRIGSASGTPSFLLWGDSHAKALIPAISFKARKAGLSGFVLSRNGCRPLLDIGQIKDPEGVFFNNNVVEFIKFHPEIKTVILAGRWAQDAIGHEYKQEEKFTIQLNDIRKVYHNQPNSVLFRVGLIRTINTLIGLNRKVVVVCDPPEIGFDVLRLFWVKSLTRKRYDELSSPTRNEYLERNKSVLSVMSELSLRNNVTIIHPESLLFDRNGKTIIIYKNCPLYLDDDHLSTYGSYFIAPAFNDVLL